MKRYYLSPIEFDARLSENVIEIYSVFGPGGALEGAAFSSRTWTPPGDVSHRISGWCLVWIDTADHTAIVADSRFIAIPADLDSLFGDLPSNQRNQFNNRIQQAGLVVEWNNQTSIRLVIVRTATQLDPGFVWASWSGE